MSLGDPLDAADLRQRVQKALSAFLATEETVLESLSSSLAPVGSALDEFLLTGGKRLRPAFAFWGHRAAGGDDSDAVVAAVSSLELLHACALIHDDVIDGSDLRRGRPAVHRRFAAAHDDAGYRGRADDFGVASAVVLGDLCHVWADQMFHSAGLPAEALLAALPVYDTMRVELMAGQYLDVLAQADPSPDVDGALARALRVARYKSGKYTVERPLHLGAVLAGASLSGPVCAALSDYGLPLGEAFQLRDDVLGVFGDPDTTGKPAGDDLRDGKRTALVALARSRGDAAARCVLDTYLGRPDLDAAGVARLRDVMASTGALAEVERIIAARTAEALAALDTGALDTEAVAVLRALAGAATTRHG
ncbi:MAG TPA: polyprenyl synthetase family protein [Frankiaceae bacterium]